MLNETVELPPEPWRLLPTPAASEYWQPAPPGPWPRLIDASGRTIALLTGEHGAWDLANLLLRAPGRLERLEYEVREALAWLKTERECADETGESQLAEVWDAIEERLRAAMSEE